MTVAVLLIFAAFFTLLVVSTVTHRGLLRASVRRPALFRAVLLGAAAVTVPLDLHAVGYGTVGPHGPALDTAADRLLLLNVAAACGVAALHEALRRTAAATTATTMRTATTASRPAVMPAAVGLPDDEPALRMGVLGWVGPLVALAVVTAVVALGSAGDGPELRDVGPVWACYSLLICVISATALLRRRVREAIDPREG